MHCMFTCSSHVSVILLDQSNVEKQIFCAATKTSKTANFKFKTKYTKLENCLKIINYSKSTHGARNRSKLENQADPNLEETLIKIRKEASSHPKLNQPLVSSAL